LDVDGGRVVKGVEFLDICDAGDPVELAAHYDREGTLLGSERRREQLGVVGAALGPPTLRR
jgi:hypothetical protein